MYSSAGQTLDVKVQSSVFLACTWTEASHLLMEKAYLVQTLIGTPRNVELVNPSDPVPVVTMAAVP